jgi:hypothetical protein
MEMAMRKTPAEYQRAYRQRQKAAKEQQRKEQLLRRSPDAVDEYLKRPFSGFVRNRILMFDETLDSLGVGFRKGTALGESNRQRFWSEGDQANRTMTSLERAEGLAGVFLDAARELHELINAYKLEEIEARIAEMERAVEVDPALKKLMLSRLHDTRMALKREFRRSFPEISVKGAPSI